LIDGWLIGKSQKTLCSFRDRRREIGHDVKHPVLGGVDPGSPRPYAVKGHRAAVERRYANA
jgi:hypothetical protein